MLTIRLQRKGKKNQPFFKIIVTEEKKSSTGGRFVEELGYYNPLTKERKLKGERAKYWISVGAQPSDTVYNMLVTDKVVEGKKRPQHKKSKKQQPAAETPTAPAQPATAQTPETPKEATPEMPTPEATSEPSKETTEPVPEEPKNEAAKEIDKS
jgi:small subunit ribosomal protein S16